MTVQDSIEFRVLSTAVLIASTVFIAIFAREPWWRAPFGRSVMTMAAGIWLFAIIATLRQWLGPDYRGREIVRDSAQTLVLLAMVERIVVLVRARRRKR